MEDARLRRLLEVGRSLISELDPDIVLDRLLEVARELTGARYAAIGVLDERGELLEQFLTKGINEETHRAIGNLPRGRGVLGVLIRDPRPAAAGRRRVAPGVLRLPARASADAQLPRRPDRGARRGVGKPVPD